MNSRRFGVEIEFHFAGTHDSVGKGQKLLADNGFKKWTKGIHSDGSGCEIRSPILQGKEGLKELKAVMQLLSDNDGVTNSADGFHVHHDCPEFVNDKKLKYHAVASWSNNQELIDKFVNKRRRGDGPRGYASCPKFIESDLDAIKKTGTWGRRGAINISNCRPGNSKGTIEIRQHEGTLDYEVAEAWILFGQYFLDAVLKRKRPIPKVDAVDTLLTRVRTPRHATRALKAKAANGG